MHIAAITETNTRLLPRLKALTEVLKAKQHEFKDIIKIGRTHLMDATPLTLGQEFSAYVYQLENNYRRIVESMANVYEIA